MNDPNDILEFEPKEGKKGGKEKNPFYYQDLAKEFLLNSDVIVRSYQSRSLIYDDGRYREEVEFPMILRRFLDRSKIPHNNTVVGNVLPSIQSKTYIDSHQHPELPFWFGEEIVEPTNVISYRNGLADAERLIAGDHDLIDHTPNWISLVRLPFDYEPDAACPSWLSFLDEILEGDGDRVNLLQEFAGYCLLPDASRQKMLILKGLSRSGKGTVCRVLMKLLGADNTTGYSLTSLAQRFGLGSLVGKHAAFIGEVNLQKCPDKYAILERLNSIVGCDPVEVEYKHNPIKSTVTLPTRFVISCNEFPNFADTSGALAERLLVIDFEKSKPEDQRDPRLTEKLCQEISGINNWAVQGLARLNRNDRFTVPEKMAKTINSIRREASSTYGFLQDYIVINRDLDTGNLPDIQKTDDEVKVFADDLKDAYEWWCAANDAPESSAWLARNLKTILPKLPDRSKVKNEAGSYRWAYKGLRVKPGYKNVGKT